MYPLSQEELVLNDGIDVLPLDHVFRLRDLENDSGGQDILLHLKQTASRVLVLCLQYTLGGNFSRPLNLGGRSSRPGHWLDSPYDSKSKDWRVARAVLQSILALKNDMAVSKASPRGGRRARDNKAR